MDKEEAGAASPKNWKIEEIRCIAVIMVISAHFSLMTRIFWEHYQIPFYLGAELFLVISGYFIGIKIKKERFSLLSYLKKRILKIYPPLIVLIAAAWEVNSICSQLSYIDPNLYCDAESFVGASLDILLCNYWGNHRYYVFSHLWYIKVLMWAYIFMAVLGKCFNFFGKKKAKYLGVCFGIAAVFFICVRSFMLIGVNFRGGIRGYLGF